MSDQKQCDGQTFLGFTVEKCDQPAVHHIYVDKNEQYDFCPRHYYFDRHGHYPEDETKGRSQDDGRQVNGNQR